MEVIAFVAANSLEVRAVLEEICGDEHDLGLDMNLKVPIRDILKHQLLLESILRYVRTSVRYGEPYVNRRLTAFRRLT